MLAAEAIAKLTREFSLAIGSMDLQSGEFGKPNLVKQIAKESELLFQGYAKAKPSAEDAYAAAKSFLQGNALSQWEKDLIAPAIAIPIREFDNAMVLGHKNFEVLLKQYEVEVNLEGDESLWRLTWHGLLYSYFNYDPNSVSDDSNSLGWEMLRSFLDRTWSVIYKKSDTNFIPDWLTVLKNESDLLSMRPAEKYAKAYLFGETETVSQIAGDLGIPPSSWFWHTLVLSAVKYAALESDTEFNRLIPNLLTLIQNKPGFRDEALELILIRYEKSKGLPPNETLRDFVCHPTVWKNPKLKMAGIATAWNRVPDAVWRMVLNWVNEGNLKDFFDILAARNSADEGRLAFWSRYLKQITWTRLVFGATTMSLQNSNSEVRKLIAREDGAYAQLTGKREVDAFMMQIDSYIIIEFSKKPNACYVYVADQLPFEPYSKFYTGGSEDLKGFQQGYAARIVHTPGWEERGAQELRNLGIRPDRVTNIKKNVNHQNLVEASNFQNNSVVSHSNVANTGPDINSLRTLMIRFRGASVIDERSSGGIGRLWVDDPLQRDQLGFELDALGFKWATSKKRWYYPEN